MESVNKMTLKVDLFLNIDCISNVNWRMVVFYDE